MKKLIFNILFLVIYINAHASHIAGADLTYKCLGGNNYLITLSFYRDCSGIQAPDSVSIDFKSSCYSEFSLYFQRIPGTGQEVTPTCKSAKTYCSGGNLYGIQQYIFQGQAILPPCHDWQISYSLCCRNYSNTLINPTGSSMFILATLDNVDAPCSSSPVFSNIPITIICVNETFCFNHGAIDPDGDSLTYSLVPPYDLGPGQNPDTVIYANGYSSKQPIPSVPPITLNNITGEICMSPTVLIISPMAILVQKYRKDVLVGSVLRDMQVHTIPCSDKLPLLSGIDSANTIYNANKTNYNDTVCLGKTVDFTIYGYDPNGQGISITWNDGIPDAEFIVSNNDSINASAEFKWTPTDLELRNNEFCFTATVANNACPYVGTQTYSYCIAVKGFVVSLGNNVILCKGQTYLAQAKADPNVVNFQWQLDGNPISIPPSSNSYLINSNDLSIGNHIITVAGKDNSVTTVCPGYAYLQVLVEENPTITLSKNIKICQGKDTVLDAGPNAVRYLWSTGDTTRSIIVNQTGSYSIIAYGGAGPQCEATDTVQVKVIPFPSAVNLGKDTCIVTNNPAFTIDAGNNPSGVYYLWSDGERTQKINVMHSGKYIVTVTYDSLSKCFHSSQVTINLLKPHFLGNDTTVCSNFPITINGPVPTDGYTYSVLWQPGGVTTPNLYLPGTQVGVSEISILVHGGCRDTINVRGKVCNLKIPNVFDPNSTIDSNRRFAIINIKYYINSNMEIFNRWGVKVFESAHYEIADNWWDGDDLNTNNKCSPGVYFYILSVSGQERKSGTVTLLR